jgi:hypothetical protein
MTEFAFPLHNHGAQTLGMHLSGMTLRDYFAAAALPMAIQEMNEAESYDSNDAAIVAYQYADAMMEARQL